MFLSLSLREMRQIVRNQLKYISCLLKWNVICRILFYIYYIKSILIKYFVFFFVYRTSEPKRKRERDGDKRWFYFQIVFSIFFSINEQNVYCRNWCIYLYKPNRFRCGLLTSGNIAFVNRKFWVGEKIDEKSVCVFNGQEHWWPQLIACFFWLVFFREALFAL